MWIRTTDGVLVNLDCYKRVAADDSGTYVYETKHMGHRISCYDAMAQIEKALRDGKKYLNLEEDCSG